MIINELWGVQGVVVAFRVVDGSLRKGDVIRLMNTAKEYQVDEVGVRAPVPTQVILLPTYIHLSATAFFQV